jgi:hypothetical protein
LPSLSKLVSFGLERPSIFKEEHSWENIFHENRSCLRQMIPLGNTAMQKARASIHGVNHARRIIS